MRLHAQFFCGPALVLVITYLLMGGDGNQTNHQLHAGEAHNPCVPWWKLSACVTSRRLGDRAFLLGATSEMQLGHEVLLQARGSRTLS